MAKSIKLQQEWCTAWRCAKDTVTEFFGNMTTKQAGLLGTSCMFQSQWGIVSRLPVSLDNTPSFPCEHISHSTYLIGLSGLSFLPWYFPLSSYYYVPFIQTSKSHSKSRTEIKWGLRSIRGKHYVVWSVGLLEFIFSECIQIRVICSYCTSVCVYVFV